jgi:hypothetical protein
MLHMTRLIGAWLAMLVQRFVTDYYWLYSSNSSLSRYMPFDGGDVLALVHSM